MALCALTAAWEVRLSFSFLILSFSGLFMLPFQTIKIDPLAWVWAGGRLKGNKRPWSYGWRPPGHDKSPLGGRKRPPVQD